MSTYITYVTIDVITYQHRKHNNGLTHLPLDKMVANSHTAFSKQFHEWKIVNFDLKLIEFCSLGSNWQ